MSNTTTYKTCTKCDKPIPKVVVNDLRIVDLEIRGLCFECAGEDGMTASEAVDSLSAVLPQLAKHSLTVESVTEADK